MRNRIILLLLLLLVICVTAFSQQFRGSITGSVLDQQQAVIAGVSVTATHIDTGARFQTVSGQTGQYTLPFLQPGFYRVEAEISGFKRYLRERVQVRANEQAGLDIAMELGGVAETVTITSEAPMLTTTTASAGQVIGSKMIASFPMNGRSPLTMAQIAFGVTPTSDPLFQRPFDNGRISEFSMGGAPSGSNELLLDGAPDTNRTRQMAFSPPVDTVEEVKVETFQADAAYGNTGGGTVNVVTKGGTNQFHGTAYDFNQVTRTAATDFFVNRAGQTKNNLVYNQYGFTAGAPLVIPRLFNGRNRVFWYFAYEEIKHINPEPVTTTVPTAGQREGNFSDLLAAGGNYQLYDPSSGVREGSRVRRQPLPNNVIPRDRLNPIAINYLQYYPLPNQPGRSDGRDNFLANSRRTEDFDTEMGRVDVNISDYHKLFANFRHNNRLQNRGDLFKNIGAGNNLIRVNWGATVDDVYTFNPTTLLNTRLNWTRFTTGNDRPSLGFDMQSFGFPAALAAASSQALLPEVAISGYQTLGHSGSQPFPYEQFQLFSNLTKIRGNHNLKLGADIRILREHNANFGSASGRYDFNTNWTRGPLDNSPAAPIGQSLASFMIGLPTGGQYDAAAFRSNQAGYLALFLQDDWKVSRTLTLNFGLRYEKEMATTERFNRQVVGFDAASENRITRQAKAAYAARPIAGLPASQFNPAGGVVYATPDNRAIADTDSRLFSPRFGFAWSPDVMGRKTVIRGGFGIFYFTEGLIPSQQPGYFQRTPLVATLDGFLTPAASLSNGFPNGVLAPVGNADGINSFLGQSINYYNPFVNNPYSNRWNLSVQRELSANHLLEIGYIGNHAVKMTLSRNLNFVPRNQLSTSPVRDQAVIDRLTANVANPLQGLLPGTSLNGSTIAASQLMRPYPQFTGDGGVSVTSDNFGSSYYHGLQARLEKRLSAGFAYMVNYQFARLIEKRSFLNPSDLAPEKRIAEEDRPHQLVISGVYELPFGRGKRFGGGAGPVSERVFGGWSLSGAYTYASGSPLAWGNVIYLGGPLNLDSRNVDNAFDTSRFVTNNQQQLDWNIRALPTRFSNLRQSSTNNFDVSILKDFLVKETVKLQFRTEFFNALNHPQFGVPNTTPTNTSFGKITSQYNLPRTTQMALRLMW